MVLQFVFFALIFAAPFLTRQWSGWDDPWGTIGRVLGLLLLGIGGLLALGGLASLGRNLTAVPHPKDDATLVEYGAYKIVRQAG